MRALDASQAEYLASAASPRLLASGFAIVPPSREPGHMTHAPFALLPRPFARSAFESATSLAELFNTLVDAISRDASWLRKTLASAATADPFTARLLGILDAVESQPGGVRQPLSLGVHRSDYMVDRGPDGASPPRLAQIELNTVSSSFAGLSQQVSSAHRYVLRRFAPTVPLAGQHLRSAVPGASLDPSNGLNAELDARLPHNDCLDAIAAGLVAGHGRYVERQIERMAIPPGDPLPATFSPVVLFIVQHAERNIMDQRLLEQALFDTRGVRARRLTLAQLAACGRLRARDGALLIPSEWLAASEGAMAPAPLDDDSEWDEVSVVYYRAGYTPDDYPGEAEWAARLLAERSLAVKCPNIAYHLAGAKKVQQALAAPGEVERFLPPIDAAALRTCFVGLWSLDPADAHGDDATAAAVADAITHPDRYVMKPQREGGGNNVYGPAITKALAPVSEGGLPPSERAGFILMQRVFPRPSPTWFVRAGSVSLLPAVSELGVYSVYLGDGTPGAEPLLNVRAGHLLRTKVEGTDEGGVAAGFAVLDSPLLTDE